MEVEPLTPGTAIALSRRMATRPIATANEAAAWTVAQLRPQLSPQQAQVLALVEAMKAGKADGRYELESTLTAIHGGVRYVREPGVGREDLWAALMRSKDGVALSRLLPDEVLINQRVGKFMVRTLNDDMRAGPFALPETFDYAAFLGCGLIEGHSIVAEIARSALHEYPAVALNGLVDRHALPEAVQRRLESITLDEPSGTLARLAHLSGTLAGPPPTRVTALIDFHRGDLYLSGHRSEQLLGPFSLPLGATNPKGMAALRGGRSHEVVDGYQTGGTRGWTAPAPIEGHRSLGAKQLRAQGIKVPDNLKSRAVLTQWVNGLSPEQLVTVVRIGAWTNATNVAVERLQKEVARDGLLKFAAHFTAEELGLLERAQREAASGSQGWLTDRLIDARPVAVGNDQPLLGPWIESYAALQALATRFGDRRVQHQRRLAMLPDPIL